MVYRLLQRSHFGWAFRALRDDEIAAELAGVDVKRYRVFAGTVGAAMFGLAGALYAHSEGFISPSTFGFGQVDVRVLVMLAFGGIGSLLGPVVGAAAFTILDEWLVSFDEYRLMIYGAVIILLFLGFPRGLVPTLQSSSAKRRRRAPHYGRSTMTERGESSLVHIDIADSVATITLDSPANRNALSSRLVADLNAALDRAEADVAAGAVRAIVLTHVPPAFCAGADLKERAAGVPDSRPIVRAFTRLMDADVPTIAAVKGPVRAGRDRADGVMRPRRRAARRRLRPHRGQDRRRRGDHLGPDPPPGQRLAARRRVPHRRAVRRLRRTGGRVGHPRHG